jgi:hypothetical protein
MDTNILEGTKRESLFFYPVCVISLTGVAVLVWSRLHLSNDTSIN